MSALWEDNKMTKDKKPRGRPRKKPFPEMGEKELAKLRNIIASGATKEGVRMFFELSNDSFYERFLALPEVQEMFEKGKDLRNTMLRMRQMSIAMEGNVPMLIHLGKTELGQTEKTEIRADLSHDFKLNKTDEDIINEFVSKRKEQSE